METREASHLFLPFVLGAGADRKPTLVEQLSTPQNKNRIQKSCVPVWQSTMPPWAGAPCRHVFTMELASRLSPTPDGTAKTMGRYAGQCVGWQHDLARARH